MGRRTRDWRDNSGIVAEALGTVYRASVNKGISVDASFLKVGGGFISILD